MKRTHTPLYIVVTLLCAALVVLQPVDAGALDADSVVAISDQVWSTIATTPE